MPDSQEDKFEKINSDAPVSKKCGDAIIPDSDSEGPLVADDVCIDPRSLADMALRFAHALNNQS